MRLGERAEQLRAAVCAAAQAATAAQSRMQPLENAETYMRLALLATQARAAKLALDEAAAAAGSAIAQLVTDQLANQEAQNQSNVATERDQAGAPAAEHLNMHFDHTDVVDVTNAGDLLREAKAAADAAQAAAAAAISIWSSPAVGQARSAATKAQFASSSAARMPGLIHAAAANPPPQSCADAAKFANRITALRKASATLAVGQAADPGVSGARAQAFLNQVDAVEGVLQQADPQMNGVAQDNVDVRQQNQNLMAISTQTGNAFRRDFEKARRLLAGGTGLATRAAQAANDANAGVQALHAPAISLPPAITSLRATLDTIETEAQAASLLIPYDPAANSNNAMTAIDQLAIAESAIDDLSKQLAITQRQARRIAYERAEKQDTANRLVISRKIAVYNAVKQAGKQSWVSWLVEQCPLIGREGEATKAARLLEQAQEAYDALLASPTELQRVAHAHAAALVCFNTARQASQAAAQLRVQQLMTEGHGPQRHEGMPTEKTLKERAVYRIDPETQTQCDVEEGIHCADLVSSKFVSNEIYVKAEALGRAAARERLRLDPLADPTSRVPLHQIGANFVIGYRCAVRPEPVETSLGSTVRIPTRGEYFYGPNVPPPDRSQMDTGAMQKKLNEATRIGYAPNDEALVVLRRDINGILYLRTMFPQHAVQ